MLFHTQLLSHVKAVHAWHRQRGGTSTIDMQTFRLTVTNRGQTIQLLPQFVFNADGRIRYRPDLVDEVSGMIGWLPYFNRRWPEGFDKLAFKRSMSSAGIRVPAHWFTSAEPLENVLIKQPRLSFGEGMRGPFRMIDEQDARHRLAGDEFYEQLIPGAMLKVWFWNETPVSADRRLPPAIIGNGTDTVLKLTTVAFDLHQPHRATAFARAKQGMTDLLAFQGVDWETILPAGAPVVVDFLYGSTLFPSVGQNQNVVSQLMQGPLRSQLLDAGAALRAAIPETYPGGSLFSADAVIDPFERIWWLEMNCNPMMPPETYRPMLDQLFGYSSAPGSADPI